MMKLTFSAKAKKAIRLVQETGKNVFITGKAGTGKSTLLEFLRNQAMKNTVVLAPTGVAAINVNGDTIHSFFKLKPGYEKEEARKVKINRNHIRKFLNLQTLMIDEISMVRADLLDAVDIYLQRVRNDSNPFGGVQMVFFGDLYQLPPVITFTDRQKFYSEYQSPYFFDAKVFQGSNDFFSESFELELVELDKIYRQKDMDFINILNAVRNNSVKYEHLSKLNKRFDADFVPKDEDNYVHLMTTNADAGRINTQRLSMLQTQERTFRAFTSGKIARNMRPNDEEITIKIGAQVMFICNDPKRRWVNGTIGRVVNIIDTVDADEHQISIMVEKNDGKLVEVGYHSWEISRYIFQDGQFKREIIGSFRQIPLKLAWAITIHKSQGKSFDKVIIDLGRGSFAHGQTYVALSRCTTMDGLVLRNRLQRSNIITDPRVKAFGK